MKIIVLTDYKNQFETKFTASPYRSGFDKKALESYFSDFQIRIEFKAFSDIDFENDEIKNQYYLYTRHRRESLNQAKIMTELPVH